MATTKNGQVTTFNGQEVIFIDATVTGENDNTFYYGTITKKTRKGVEIKTTLLIQGTKENVNAKFLAIVPQYVNRVCTLEKLELKWIHGGYAQEIHA